MTPVTVIAAGPCVVTQLKTIAKDGYSAAQIGFEDVKEHRLTMPLKGHFAAHEVKPKRTLREIPIEPGETLAEGHEFSADIFVEGDKVAVTGISKGKLCRCDEALRMARQQGHARRVYISPQAGFRRRH